MSTPPLRSSKTIRKGIEERVSTPYPMASTWNDSVKHITSSWGVLILITLQDGTMRFSELRRRVTGVSERMLSQTLQWLEGDGLVARRSYAVVPPHTDYTLTPLGAEAAEKVAALANWIEDQLPQMRRSKRV